jgi:hypothetical protein
MHPLRLLHASYRVVSAMLFCQDGRIVTQEDMTILGEADK